MDAWLKQRGVTLIGADLDESPMAYRRLPDVLAHHAGTVRVLHNLRPFAVVMAGSGEYDPFKDSRQRQGLPQKIVTPPKQTADTKQRARNIIAVGVIAGSRSSGVAQVR